MQRINQAQGVASMSSIKRQILMIEDEPGLRMTVSDRLENEGYDVQTVGDGDTGLDLASSGAFDLVLLDLMLPGKNGFDVCRDLRQRGVDTPVIMLTARGQVVDKIVGLKLGADDYITKPFEMMELLARIEARLRRGSAAQSSTQSSAALAAKEGYRFGDVWVDFRGAEVTRAGSPIELSAQEFKLLRYFIENRGTTLSRNRLLDEVWGYDAMPTTRTVDVHVAWLRQKLEPSPRRPQYIATIHGLGYKFVG
jgi:two-component system alkaline phosphatase synthesis response regulator PhoP